MSSRVGENPVRAEPHWPPVVIGGAYYTARCLLRDLTRRGISGCCIDGNRDNPAFHSVYGPAYECPDPDSRPSDWVSFMLALAAKMKTKPVFISSSDQFVTALAAHAAELRDHFIFHDRFVDQQALLATKQRQYALAAQYGMPIPRSGYVESLIEVEQFASIASFPCLMKPLHCREWEDLPSRHPFLGQKVITVETPTELTSAYLMAAEFTPSVVLQEIIAGPDTSKFVYLSCYGRGGDRIGNCIVREVRTSPMDFGSASLVEPTLDPEVDEVCNRFLLAMGYIGLCEIEVKRDSRDGRLMMIEANPRYSGTADAAPYAGVDLGWLHYLDLIGQDITPVGPNGRDFRHVCLQRDFSAQSSYRHAGLETWRSILRSYRPPIAFYDFDLRDWRVSALTVLKLARVVAGQVFRKFFPKRGKNTVRFTASSKQ